LSEGGAGVAVPASHVDDALKSLIILSSGGAKVSAIEFPSVVSDGAARSLAGLPPSGDSPVDFAHVLESLKGFRVQLVGAKGVLVRGRLLDVEATEHPAPAADGKAASGEPKRNFELLVVAEDGALVRTRASDVERIEPLDREFSARLQTAADALGGRAAQLGRTLRVLAQSNAPVRIGYIAETPVWRSSYRLVLPKDGPRAALQGFALVHNDTDEPWQDVAIELVNGTPDSFLFPLAAPRYMRRALNTPDDQLSTVPQLASKTPDGLWGDNLEDEEESEEESTSGYGDGAGELHGRSARAPKIRLGHGSGSAGGSVPSPLIEIGDLAAVPKAAAKDEGRLFSYRLSELVSLRAHGSALLPFLGSAVTARRLTRFQRDGVARAVVRFQNDSPYILPAGPLAIFENAGFAGETVIQRLVPGKRAFMAYGEDLDVVVRDEKTPISRTAERVVWNARGGLIEEHYVEVSEYHLSLRNDGATARTVAWSLAELVHNAKVEGADELDFDDGSEEPLALFAVPSRKTIERTLHVTEGKATWFSIHDLSRETAQRLSNEPRLAASTRAAFKGAMPQIEALNSARERRDAIEERRHDLQDDLERNREHLQAAEGSAGGANPIAIRIVELEKAQDAARSDLAKAEKDLEELGKKATAALRDLEVSTVAPSHGRKR
jgi:hypothetical protein